MATRFAWRLGQDRGSLLLPVARAFGQVAQSTPTLSMQHIAPLRRKLDPKPLNVVVVGPSQSGKSTYLALLHDMFGTPKPASLQTGSGNESTTTKCHIYTLLARHLLFQDLLPRDLCEEHGGMSHEERMEAFFDRTGYKAEVSPNDDAQPFRMKLLDTPGYDDSSENQDEQHAENVLTSLMQLESVHAFIFVLGKGVHYGGGFQQVFLQYWNTFDRFQDRFIILHTKWDPTVEGLEDEKQKRVDIFKRTFRDVGGLKHVFIDAKWGKTKHQFPQHKKALAAHSINEILAALSVYEPMPAANLTYYKTPAMRQFDTKLEAYAKGQLEGATEALKNVGNMNAEAHDLLASSTSELETKRSQLANVDKRLNEIDIDELTIASYTDVSHPGYYFSESKSPVEVDVSPHYVRGYTTSLSSDEEYSEWVDVKYSGTKLTGTLKSVWWASHSGSLYAKVRVKDKHANEIVKLHSEQGALNVRIADLNGTVQKWEEKMKSGKREQQKLQSRIKLIGKCIGNLKQVRLTLEELSKVKHLYKDTNGQEKALFEEYCRAVWPEQTP